MTPRFIQRFSCFLLLVFCLSCRNNTPPGHSAAKETPKDSIPVAAPVLLQVDQLIFGIYVGECARHCATMFKYTHTGEHNLLYADYTDSFFSNGQKLVFDTKINDPGKIKLAASVPLNIPREMLEPGEDKKYGCPDCTDGGALYVELTQKNSTRKFHIDLHNPKLDMEIKTFAAYMHNVIIDLKKEN